MSKNVLIISSSPRKGGNSDSLSNEFERGARDGGHIVEKISLRDKKINYCIGCGKCFAKHEFCWQEDDAVEITKKMLEADVIVLTTPVYFYAMSAQLKTLLDRTCGPYLDMKNKEFYLLATAAEGEEEMEHLSRVFDNLMGYVDCLENATVRGKLLATGVYKMKEIEGHRALMEAYEMGRNV